MTTSDYPNYNALYLNYRVIMQMAAQFEQGGSEHFETPSPVERQVYLGNRAQRRRKAAQDRRRA